MSRAIFVLLCQIDFLAFESHLAQMGVGQEATPGLCPESGGLVSQHERVDHQASWQRMQ
jgi:hypothetical protein